MRLCVCPSFANLQLRFDLAPLVNTFLKDPPQQEHMASMKLIVTGATGFVGQEVIRQSLSHPQIGTIVALARSPVVAPEKLPAGSDPSKLKSVVIQDYEVYPEEIKKEFSGANACIWYASFIISLFIVGS
ncbi:hypothetical protein CIB48_g1178 [Xylaria polymorpha]|nr:hypothetical protein CIB48_g1178 [Xylaria polymorpha]